MQGDNRDAKNFSYNFITKNTGDVLNFTLKLIDDENKEIKFEDKEKNHEIPIVNFLLEFLAWVNLSKKTQKTSEQHMEDVIVDLGKVLANFQLTVQKKDKTIQEYLRLLKLTKQKYQKLFRENKLFKERINSIEKEKVVKKLQKKDNIR